MFRQLSKKIDNSGIILVTVLIILMVMGIIMMAILSQSMSQSKTSTSQVDQIVAEELAKGAFWRSYNSQSAGGRFSNQTNSISRNGRTFNFVTTYNTVTNSAQVNIVY